jgi:probable HAF family extracellular repeat protein
LVTHTAIDLGTLGGSSSWAKGINSRGQVVGYSDTTGGLAQHGMLWSDGALIDLNSFVDAAAASDGWVLTNAYAINDDGLITGVVTYADGDYHAFLLTPVPEPQTYVLALAGLCVIGHALRRRQRPAMRPAGCTAHFAPSTWRFA